MKQVVAAILLLAVLLCGCHGSKDSSEEGVTLRQSLLNGNGCAFSCVINADFGQTEYAFRLDCQADKEGTVHFRVIAPEEISKIEGSVDHQSGKLTFDDTVLSFPLLAQGEISPVCAPWLFYKALMGGYIRASGKDHDGLRLTIDDSFQGESLTLEIWLDEGIPIWAEIVWQGRKLITLDISEFRIL